MTGETGAGKTLLLGALRLLLGETARKDRIGPIDDTLAVEARLAIDGGADCIQLREKDLGDVSAFVIDSSGDFNKAEEALAAVKGGNDLPQAKIWVCPVCGNTVMDQPPDKCPICGVARDKFSVVE